MSEELYRTILYFDGRKGLAKAEGVCIDLTEVPVIVPLPEHTVQMYFYPQVRDYRLRESAQAIRDMHPPEIEAVISWLAKIAAFGRLLRTPRIKS